MSLEQFADALFELVGCQVASDDAAMSVYEGATRHSFDAEGFTHGTFKGQAVTDGNGGEAVSVGGAAAGFDIVVEGDRHESDFPAVAVFQLSQQVECLAAFIAPCSPKNHGHGTSLVF